MEYEEFVKEIQRQEEMEDEVADINAHNTMWIDGEIELLKEEWLHFVVETFPIDIVKILNGLKYINMYEPANGYGDCLYSKIEIDGYSISTKTEDNDRCLYFIFKHNDVVQTLRYYRAYGKDEYGIRFDTYTSGYDYWPSKNEDKGTKSEKQISKEITFLKNNRAMLEKFQELTPQIYSQIAERNAERIAKRKKTCNANEDRIADKAEEKPKTYKITIEVEEVE